MLARIEKGRLHFAIKLQELAPSRSGKTIIVASTRGPKKSTVEIDGKHVFVNANAYVFPDQPTHQSKQAGKKSVQKKPSSKKPATQTITEGA